MKVVVFCASVILWGCSGAPIDGPEQTHDGRVVAGPIEPEQIPVINHEPGPCVGARTTLNVTSPDGTVTTLWIPIPCDPRLLKDTGDPPDEFLSVISGQKTLR